MTKLPPFESLPSIPEEFKPKVEGDFLVLCANEGPTFIKKGTTKIIRTGVKLRVPAKHLAAVTYRQKHGNGYVFSEPSLYPASQKLGEDGKPVEGSDGEGLTGEILVAVAAPVNVDLTIRYGETFAVAFLLQGSALPWSVTPEEKPPAAPTQAKKTGKE